MWVASVFLPVWETRADITYEWQTFSGLWPLLMGWFGILMLCPAWTANLLFPVMIFGWREVSSTGYAVSLIAVIVAATAYYFPELPFDYESAVIISRMAGFYLWLGAFVLLFAGQTWQLNSISPAFARRRWNTLLAVAAGLCVLELLFRTPGGLTPLERVVRNPANLAAVRAELARHPMPIEIDAAFDAAVHYAVIGRKNPDAKDLLRQVELLLEAGAHVDHRNAKGDPALIDAVESEPLVELLLRHGASVNAPASGGLTAIMIADTLGNEAVWNRLLAAGAAVPKDGPRNIKGAATQPQALP